MNSEVKFKYTVSAPGKVILFGEHSVVYKKAAVSTSISRRLFVKVNILKEGEVFVSCKLPNIGGIANFNLKQINEVVKEKLPLQPSDEDFTIARPDLIDHKTYIDSLKPKLINLGISISQLPEKTVAAYLGFLYVLQGMCHSLSCDLAPFSLEINSDLEVGTGIGSSSAFAVAVSAAILQYRKCLEISNSLTSINLSEVKDNVVVLSGNNSSGFSLSELRVINKWAFCIEKIMHGNPSGIDNTTSTFGSVVMTSQEDTGRLTFRFLEKLPKISVLLISTGVTRNTGHLVSKVRTLRGENCASVDAILNAMDIISREAFKILEDLGVSSSYTTKGTELYKTLGNLMELNHGLLRTLGVSHESLEIIVSTCGRHGLASKLTGAGGGGYAIALVPPNFSRDDLQDLKDDLDSEFKVTEISIAEQGVRLEK